MAIKRELHSNPEYIRELVEKYGEGAHYMETDEGPVALVVEGGSARLHIKQETKPMWDIVVYYDEQGKIEGEGVKRAINWSWPKEDEEPVVITAKRKIELDIERMKYTVDALERQAMEYGESGLPNALELIVNKHMAIQHSKGMIEAYESALAFIDAELNG